MKILITGPGTYTEESADKPEQGRRYFLEPAEDGTGEQNRAFHALLQEYWKSGLHPKYGGDPFSVFKDKIKRDLGQGFEAYVYADIIDGKPRIFQVKKEAEIPAHINNDPDRRQMIQGKLKSWTKYTMRQRMKLIDNIIDDAKAAGLNSKKFNEIVEGMQRDKNRT